MIRCKLVNILFWLLPINQIRSYLIQKHILQCPHCLEKLASASEVRSLLATENSPETKVDLWPFLKQKLNTPQEKRKSAPFLQKRWAYAAAGILIAFASGFFIFYSLLDHQPKEYLSSSSDIQIQYINVQSQPANTYYYHSPDSDFVFIWAEKN
jgi:hypothetical protein